MTLDTMFDQAPKRSGPQGSMRSVRITEAHAIDIVETAIPGIGADDVLVRHLRPAASAGPTCTSSTTASRGPTTP